MSDDNEVASQDAASSDVSSASQSQTVAQEEKLLTQSEVNRIVGEVKRKERDVYDRRYNENVSSKTEPLNSGYVKESDLQRIIDERVKANELKLQQQYAAQVQAEQDKKICGDLVQKINESKSKYDDYDEIVNGDFLKGSDELLRAVNEVPNSGDVLYYLGNNLLKVGSLKNLTPAQSRAELRKLSKSIQANQSASSTSLASEPLTQSKPGSSSAKARKIDTIDWHC